MALQGWLGVRFLGDAVALLLQWRIVPIHSHPISGAFTMAPGRRLLLATAQE